MPERYGGDAPDIDTVLALWRGALAAPLHGPFCACCGGAMLALTPADLERDVLDYLLPRYERDPADAVLAEAVRRRLTGPETSVAAWLAMQARELPEAAQRRLLADLATVLGSMAGDRPGGFVCD